MHCIHFNKRPVRKSHFVQRPVGDSRAFQVNSSGLDDPTSRWPRRWQKMIYVGVTRDKQIRSLANVLHIERNLSLANVFCGAEKGKEKKPFIVAKNENRT